jgi:hypothetical protein
VVVRVGIDETFCIVLRVVSLSRCEGSAVSEGNGVEGGATGKYAFAVIVR